MAHFIDIKFGAGAVQKFYIVLEGLEQFVADHAEKFRRVYGKIFGSDFLLSIGKGGEGSHVFCAAVINTAEFFSGADRPVHRTGTDAENGFDFIHQFKWIVGIPVHFINKSKNRNIS